MKWMYYLVVEVSTRMLPILGLVLPKIKYFTSQRASLFSKLEAFRSTHTGPLVWFHVASLGEYEQARPVIAALKTQTPLLGVVVSFFSPSGYDSVTPNSQTGVDFFTYIPLDRRAWAEKFVRMLDPKQAFFVKYDLWYHHLCALKSRQVPTYLISASFRPEHRYFSWYGAFFRGMLAQLDWIFTQNEESLQLLKRIGIQQASLTGDTRFDRVEATASRPKELPEIRNWVKNTPTVVVGSAWEEDMELLIPLILSRQEYLWIIAPHALDVAAMDRWAERLPLLTKKYSSWNFQDDCKVLFIDNIGMLSSLYQFAYIAYVGGAFGKGLHNILEPLGFAVPVIFGKVRKKEKFPEAKQSQIEGCGFEVSDAASLKDVFAHLEQPETHQKASHSAQRWVKESLGSADRIVAQLRSLPLSK